MSQYQAIVIGISAGGIESLSLLIPQLPKTFPIPIIVVQHRRDEENDYLVQHLNSISAIQVVQAEPNQSICSGYVYIAPGGYHLLIEREKQFSLSLCERVNYCIPSIDVLFETAAQVYQDTLIGIILTGANSDGAKGLKIIKEMGGTIIVEDPKTAQVSTMPESAIKYNDDIDYILPLEQLLHTLNIITE